MRPLTRQVEDVGCDLHGRIALRAATGDAHFGDASSTAFLDAFLGLAQSVGQTFEDGAVQMSAGVHIAKTDDGALGLRSGNLDAWVPEWLQHQALRARRHGIDQFVKHGFRRDAALLRNLFFMQAKLLLEPAYHPEPPGDLDFSVVVLGNGCLVGRNEGRGFKIA